MTSRLLLLGRVFTAVVGLAYAAAAVQTLTRVSTEPEFIRSFTLPGYAAEASLMALIALLTLAGATVHVAALAPGLLTMLALIIARYDSESSLAPLVGISTALIAYVYSLAGMGAIRALAAPRRLLLAGAVALAVIAIVSSQDTPQVLDWQRFRTRSGEIELRRSVFPGRCRVSQGAKDKDEIDSGCVQIVPKARARKIIALDGGAAVLALAGIAGAPRLRRLPDGALVPPWGVEP